MKVPNFSSIFVVTFLAVFLTICVSVYEAKAQESTDLKSCGCNPDPVALKKCTGGAQQGTQSLSTHCKLKYGNDVANWTETYNCRLVAGTKNLSLHAVGRAVDVYPGSQQVFDDMVSTACKSGIQEVIYNGKIWTKADGTKAYDGVDPHKDRVHIGLNNCGARQEVFEE